MTAEFIYTGRVPEATRSAALRCYETYRSDRESYIARVRDNERYYRSFYERSSEGLVRRKDCSTPLLFACIDNAAADASSSYPVPHILERDPAGTEAAESLSKLLPVQLDMCRFRQIYNANMHSKLKFGTAIYGVFYDGASRSIDIRAVDIMDIYIDMHLKNVQDSRFMFISAAVDNDILKEQYPQFARLFSGDCEIEGIASSYKLTNRCEVLDCYYKKSDGTVHMMKLCKGTIIEATEDMDGYGNGLYDHGLYPVVIDNMYPIEDCPFGFGMLDIGKATQIQIDKLDNAITKNVMITARQRYFSKRSSGINIEEFSDIDRDIVSIEGDIEEAAKPILTSSLTANPIVHRENKKSELKELLANRDFQQGQTTGGVTAASAIKALRETGEKRSRKMIARSYDAYKELIYMTIELIRQFYDDERTFRVDSGNGKKEFIAFSNRSMKRSGFDIEVIPQAEDPLTQEQQNETALTLWNAGFFLPQNLEPARIVLKSMDFKGKGQLINDIESAIMRGAGGDGYVSDGERQ